MKRLVNSLGLQYSGELINGITKILVVADDPNTPSVEPLARQKARTAIAWGNIKVVNNRWLEDSAQRGTLCDPNDYTLLPRKASVFTSTGQALGPYMSLCSLASRLLWKSQDAPLGSHACRPVCGQHVGQSKAEQSRSELACTAACGHICRITHSLNPAGTYDAGGACDKHLSSDL